ncbi:MAG: DNA translocase FtsK [Bacteroidaceae bacterium]|nr:DNA translocase FtsK [Bacteroidaceae bacterium]
MTKRNPSKAPAKSAGKRRVAQAVETPDNSLQFGVAIKGDKDEPLKRGEAIRMACGIILLALAVFTLISLVSHLFTGGEDQKVLQSGYLGSAKNWAGYIGAWWSDFWITENFGLGSFFISIFLLAASLKLTGACHIRLWKWFVNCAILLCWVSVAAAFFLTGAFAANPDISYISPGGYHGINVVNFLKGISGPVGTFIILLLTLLAYLSYLSTETVLILKRLMHPRQLAHDLGQRLPSINIPSIRNHSETEDTAHQEEESRVETAPDTEANPDEVTDTSAANVLELSIEQTTPTSSSETKPEFFAVTTPGEDGIPVAKVAEEPVAPQEPDTSWINAAAEEEAASHEDATDVTLTIEPPVEEEIVDEDHEAALEPYDPKLDLENYQYPTLDLLKHYDVDPRAQIDMEEQTKNKDQIVNVLRNFGVEISSIRATVGPTITLYEITPAPGVRISKIRNLEDDIALSLAALGIRIIAPIPGKGTIGIEVPNAKPQIVSMESILNSRKFQETTMELPMALGKTITNEVYMADLAKMPHLLVAGATGQGKSVGLNAIITSLLYKKHPAELKMVMVDPKKVEFSIYSPIINHFLAQIEDEDDEPIITDVQKVINTLKSLCVEMDTRYDLLKKARARNLKEYNEKFKNRQLNPENGHKFMPYIVVIIDEFGDLIMTAGKEIELPIARIAQLARAVGIHMIIATQRPTTNIITGTIKANFPARMAFKVSAMIDSRTILDRPGANQLVGKGDMLFLAGNEPVRVQCAFVDTPEVEQICAFIARQQSYLHPFELPRPPMEDGGGGANDVDMDHLDPMFADAARLIITSQQGSTSLIQRKFAIGYNRAGRLMDQLEKAGVVGPAQGSKPRDVLIQDEMSLEMLLNNLG